MNVLKMVLIGCLVLILNNVILLNYIGYFSKPGKIIEPTPNTEEAITTDSKSRTHDKPQTALQIDRDDSDINKVSLNEEQMIGVLRNVAETDDFISILDNYQLAASRRYLEMQRKFGAMDSDDLFDVVQNADSKKERQFALQVLAQGNFGELDTYQLKSILEFDDLQNWYEGKVLSNLLERQDSDALDLAKTYMSNGEASMYMDHDLVRNVFDLDPKFIQESINKLDLSRGREPFTMLSVALEDSNISKQFYEENIDEILESTNSNLFNHLGTPPPIDLTGLQQNKIIDLLQSPNRQKRRFAMGMLNSVDNLDSIRDAFHNMERDSEKRNFIYSLIGRADNPQKKQLAQELADATDDPSLQKLFQ